MKFGNINLVPNFGVIFANASYAILDGSYFETISSVISFFHSWSEILSICINIYIKAGIAVFLKASDFLNIAGNCEDWMTKIFNAVPLSSKKTK